MSNKSWMWSSLSLALLGGVGLGIIADRVLLTDAAYADAKTAPQKASPLWFICDQRGSLDIEDEPGYLYNKRFRDQLLEGLSKELGLAPDQHAEVEAFLEERRHGAHEFWENSRHTYCDMRDGFRHDLRAMLDDEQQLRFDALMAQIDEHQAEFVSRIKAGQQAKEGAAEK
ncbi:MAG TPA: hypothetical protein VHR17_02085 [Thermoanaerobaculia bacterium]|jgi:hypothetical protein|nr:hypothetical protein [Thermoanaerobaculia bacterium]